MSSAKKHSKIKKKSGLIPTPWDQKVFNLPTYEITRVDEKIFKSIQKRKGHYTIKIDPLHSKQLLHQYGFYYCDTLLETAGTRDRFIGHFHPDVMVLPATSYQKLKPLCDKAFSHGRFHRDFNVSSRCADARYNNWLEQLCRARTVLELHYKNRCVGFLGYTKNKIVLHAIARSFQGKGIAKFLWSAACETLFSTDSTELYSSISASNVAALNLYASLGFRFRYPQDVYHLLISKDAE